VEESCFHDFRLYPFRVASSSITSSVDCWNGCSRVRTERRCRFPSYQLVACSLQPFSTCFLQHRRWNHKCKARCSSKSCSVCVRNHGIVSTPVSKLSILKERMWNVGNNHSIIRPALRDISLVRPPTDPSIDVQRTWNS
jgi:hypothetical protein